MPRGKENIPKHKFKYRLSCGKTGYYRVIQYESSNMYNSIGIISIKNIAITYKKTNR